MKVCDNNIKGLLIKDIVPYNDDVKMFVVENPFKTTDIQVGGFVMLTNEPNGDTRPFSIASGNASTELVFIIKNVGRITSKLFELVEGDMIYCVDNIYRGKLPTVVSSNTGFLAMGVGIAPILSYLENWKFGENSKIYYSEKSQDYFINLSNDTDVKYFCTRETEPANADDFMDMDIVWNRRMCIDDILEHDDYIICGSKLFAENMGAQIKEKYPNANVFMAGYN